eukprot:1161927-Pelagomonas_calceolata.AAC.1
MHCGYLTSTTASCDQASKMHCGYLTSTQASCDQASKMHPHVLVSQQCQRQNRWFSAMNTECQAQFSTVPRFKEEQAHALGAYSCKNAKAIQSRDSQVAYFVHWHPCSCPDEPNSCKPDACG